MQEETFIPYVRRSRKPMHKPPSMICGTCKEKHDREGQRLCHKCHAAYQRKRSPPR